MVRPVDYPTNHLHLLLPISPPSLRKALLTRPLPPALRGPRPPPPRLLPAPRLGYPHTGHSHPSRFGGRGELFERGHDTE